MTVIERELGTAAPFAVRHLYAFLAARAVPGIEAWDGVTFHRSMDLPGGHGVVRLTPGDGATVGASFDLADERDLDEAVRRVRRLLDLDADPAAIDGVLGGNPVLAPLVASAPGLRVGGSVDPFETTVRAVIGQQISVAGARTVAGRIVASAGERLTVDGGPVTHAFPTPGALASIDPQLLPMPMSRRRTVVELAARAADGRVSFAADRDEVVGMLLAVPGIGPWTAGYVRMRGLGDPDVFLPTDLGVKVGLQRLGIGADHATQWRPWRTYALHHVWRAAGFPAE
ncbi:MAG: DNA-3-methyladenine glycosylase family protein [Ilumatobacteraceae bacterium]